MHSPSTARKMQGLNVEARRRRRLNAEILRLNAEILGGGPAIFLASVRRGGAASTEIASWGAAGCPAIGAGRAHMRRSRAVCPLRAQAGRKALAGGRYLDMGYMGYGRLVIWI